MLEVDDAKREIILSPALNSFPHSGSCCRREWLEYSSIGNQWFPSSNESLPRAISATDLQIMEILILHPTNPDPRVNLDAFFISHLFNAMSYVMPCFWGWKSKASSSWKTTIYVYWGTKTKASSSRNCHWCNEKNYDILIDALFSAAAVSVYHSLASFTLVITWSEQIIIRPNKRAVECYAGYKLPTRDEVVGPKRD